jgi:branched-chain amino acid aminotransferase
VIGLAKKRGLKVIERAIMPEELTGFSECFITGTAAEVTRSPRSAPTNSPSAISPAC